MRLPGAAETVILISMLLFGAYLAFEVWRWVNGNPGQLTPGQFRRRMVGGILLEVDLALWYFADRALPLLPRSGKLLYLLFAMLLVFVPMLLAVREAAFVMRQYARWRGELVQNLGKREAGAPSEDGTT
jgi:hypothetical protein